MKYPVKLETKPLAKDLNRTFVTYYKGWTVTLIHNFWGTWTFHVFINSKWILQIYKHEQSHENIITIYMWILIKFCLWVCVGAIFIFHTKEETDRVRNTKYECQAVSLLLLVLLRFGSENFGPKARGCACGPKSR